MSLDVRLRSKLPSVGTTIFTVMSRLAAELGAINLSQGFPDFDCDPALVDAVARHMRAGLNQYAPMQGVLALRRRSPRSTRASHGRRYDPETEVTVTSGATEAIFDAVAAVVHPGDEVDRARALLRLVRAGDRAERRRAGRGVAAVSGLPIDWDAVAARGHAADPLLIINSPHNPTGAILTAADIARADRAGRRHRAPHPQRRGLRAHHLRRRDATRAWRGIRELAARSFVVGSFGKTYHATGWKVGYAVAPAALTAELRKVHQFVTFATSTPVQHGIADFSERAARPGRAAGRSSRRSATCSCG